MTPWHSHQTSLPTLTGLTTSMAPHTHTTPDMDHSMTLSTDHIDHTSTIHTMTLSTDHTDPSPTTTHSALTQPTEAHCTMTLSTDHTLQDTTTGHTDPPDTMTMDTHTTHHTTHTDQPTPDTGGEHRGREWPRIGII